MASHTERQAKRSSIQLAKFWIISASLDVEDAVFDLALVSIQRARGRPGQDSSVFGEDAVVARAMELAVLGDPANAAAQVRADIGENSEVLTVLGQDICRDFLLSTDPACLRLH